jgi:hypothetical protein
MKIIKTRQVKTSMILITMIYTVSIINVFAQKTLPEFSIYGGGGFSFFSYHPNLRNASSGGFNADAGVGSTFFLHQQWGIYVGAGFGLYNVNLKVKSLQTITPGKEDCDMNLYELHTTLNNYNEIHKSMFLNVPLMVQFQTKQYLSRSWKKNNKPNFYAMGGIITLFLLKNSYNSKITSLSNAAYYPEFDNWIATLPSLGLGTFDGKSSEKISKFGILVMFALESGAKLPIGNNLFLYTGAFFDCALNDPVKDHRRSLKNYTDFESLTKFSILTFANRINLMTVGIKLRLAFLLSRKCPDCLY